MKRVLVKAGPRPTARDGPAAQRPGGPAAQICIAFGSQKWTTVSLNSFTILIIISILFYPFFRCMLPSEKRYHSLFIRLFTESDREEVHFQTM